MALDKIVSAGVFTNENDLSFLPQGVANIGAVIIGPTVKGPAFVPTVVTSKEDFKAKFGPENEKVSFVPYAVREYLRSASSVIVVRVLQETGYTLTSPVAVVWTGSLNGTATQRVVAVLHPSAYVSGALLSDFSKTTSTLGASGSVSGSFALKLSGSNINSTATQVSVSLDPLNANYIKNIFGTSPQSTQTGYVMFEFGNFLGSYSGSNSQVFLTSASTNATFGTYAAASTPWVVSQKLPGNSARRLFKVTSIADGTDTNKNYKISIVVTARPGTVPGSDYGTFSLFVRAWDDTDQRQNVLESYIGLTLDPSSVNYIARRIGDNYKTTDSTGKVTVQGTYANKSKYVRVIVNEDVDNGSLSATMYPKGFEAVLVPYPAIGTAIFPTASFVTIPQINGEYSDRAYYGFDYSNNDNLNYLSYLHTGSVSQSNVEFNLDNMFAHPSSSYANQSLSGSTIPTSYLKFTIPMQGGFDGMDPSRIIKYGKNVTETNMFGFDISTVTTSGSAAYIKALNTVKNPGEIDINLVVMPGVTVHNSPGLVQKAITVAEDREDCLVILDLAYFGETFQELLDSANLQSLDTNYAAVYHPWMKITDVDANKPVWVPATVGVAGVFAYSNLVGNPWDAPAGLTRGLIKGVIDIEDRFTLDNRNELQIKRVNPLKPEAGVGVAVWGNKTLQAQPSALDRVNVRQMLIAVKKYIASTTRYLVFDNNTTATRKRFENTIRPYLKTVQEKNGLYDFEVKMDGTNNGPDVIDENKMYGEIWLKPARTAEYIIIDFNITRTGASFSV